MDITGNHAPTGPACLEYRRRLSFRTKLLIAAEVDLPPACATSSPKKPGARTYPEHAARRGELL